MKRYHVFKSSRLYLGIPYCGVTSNYESMQFDCKKTALNKAAELTKKNPVGFVVYDSHTLEAVK